MRLRHPSGDVIHVAYCTNVHAAEDLDGVLAQLTQFSGPVRRRLGLPLLGVGLWLAAPLAAALAADPVGLKQLRERLAGEGLEVVTLNAFPYRGFQAERVKHAVYRPDWSEPARLEYTLDCARVLAELLPDDVTDGSISTLPLGWRSPWYADRQAMAERALAELAEGLAQLAETTGRRVRVGLEPEPGCIVETTGQAVDRLAQVDHEWIGVCVDACHLAVAHEDPAEALAVLDRGGLPVVKMQVSAALHAPDPQDPASRAALARFAEERFLHQVRTRAGDRLAGRDDLDEALTGHRPLEATAPWRVHFHVPMHAEPAAPLRSTRDELDALLGAVVGGPRPVTRHLELETYTWSVLPGRTGAAGDLVEGLAAEVDWVRGRLLAHGLEEVPA
jgi:hypothetical protein